MPRYTPLEIRLIRGLARALSDGGLPVVALKIFGSRARGHSDEYSDLDIAVELDSTPDRAMATQVASLGQRLSQELAEDGCTLRIQALPLFRGEETGYLAKAIAAEADTVWTRI